MTECEKLFLRLRTSGDDGENTEGQEPETPPKTENNTEGEPGSGSEEPKGDDDGQDFDSLPDWAKKQIKSLRSENAKHRTTSNNLSTKMEKFEEGFKKMFGEDDADADPEKKLEALSGEYEQAVTRNAILELALQNGISGSEKMEYFEFLMSKNLESLEEGEEMTEEMFEDILGKVSTQFSGQTGTTSTRDEGKGGEGPGKGADEVTQEEFNKMTIVEKSKLYQTKPELYNKLMKSFSGR